MERVSKDTRWPPTVLTGLGNYRRHRQRHSAPEKKKIGAVEARQTIKHAVARGAETYNSGHHAACAEFYMTTMRDLIEYGDQMPVEILSAMKHVLATAEKTHSPTQRAWTLRHGLDHAYGRLAHLE